MPTLARAMQKELETIPSEASISEAARIMRDRRIGALLVRDNGEIIGMVTDTDVVRKAVADGTDLGKTAVKQIMPTSLNSIEMSRSLQDAHDMMADLGVRHLVVRDAGKVVGIVSVLDLLSYFKNVSEPKIGQD